MLDSSRSALALDSITLLKPRAYTVELNLSEYSLKQCCTYFSKSNSAGAWLNLRRNSLFGFSVIYASNAISSRASASCARTCQPERVNISALRCTLTKISQDDNLLLNIWEEISSDQRNVLVCNQIGILNNRKPRCCTCRIPAYNGSGNARNSQNDRNRKPFII